MKVNLNIEEDEQFRAYVKDLISGQVRKVLREQLAGIVAGEIAKLKLLSPNSTELRYLVERYVNGAINKELGRLNMQERVRNEVNLQIRNLIAPSVDQIKQHLADQVAAMFRAKHNEPV